MTGIDAFILVMLACAIGLGVGRGWRRGVIDLVSLVGGLTFALIAWPVGHWVFRSVIGLPDLFAGPLGVGLVAAVGVVGIGWLGAKWAGREEELSRRSRVTGGMVGLLLGLIGMAPFLLLVSLATRESDQLERSRLAQPFLAALPLMYEVPELLGLRVPKVVPVPTNFDSEFGEQPRRWPTFRPINFRSLDGATCIKCRGRVKFVGYRRKEGPLPIPKFRCEGCGRTSDGCQGFESFHEMYKACPVDVAEKGYKLDCGVWTNGELIWPRGRCPVCDKEYRQRVEGQ